MAWTVLRRYSSAIAGGIALNLGCAHTALLGQSSAGDRSSLGVALGPVYRDIRDYVTPAHQRGFGGGVIRERQLGHRSTFALSIHGSHFNNETITVPAAQVLGGYSASVSARREAIARPFLDWDPHAGNHGSQTLTELNLSADVRQYLSAEAHGPYVGVGAGATYLAADEQHTSRPSVDAAAGYALQATRRIRIFAQTQCTWTGLDLQHGAAKTPRWFTAPSIGVSVSR